MKKYYLLVLLSCLLQSCNQANENVGEEVKQLNGSEKARKITISEEKGLPVESSLKPDRVKKGFLEWDSLSSAQQQQIAEFWTSFQASLRDEDIEKTMSLVHFPLSGEWGFVLGLKKEPSKWTENDLREGFSKIFTKQVIKQLLEIEVNSLEYYGDVTNNLINRACAAVLIKKVDAEFEKSRRFNFQIIDSTYKMTAIWHAG